MKTFREALEVGEIGERIADKFLIEKGIKLFSPRIPDQSNVVDRIGITPQGKTFFIETKCYPRRFVKPEQGFDLADLEAYTRLIEQNPDNCFVILFADPFEGKLLALNLSAHHKDGTIERNKVYYPLKLMKPLCDLSKEDLQAIGWSFDERYKGVKRYFQ